MRSRVALAVVCALVAGLGACGSKASQKTSVPPPPDPSAAPVDLGAESLLVPGEYLAWEVKWKGFSGGRSQLVVGQPGVIEGKRAIIVRSETKGDGLIAVFRHLRDELTTLVDLEQGVPIRSEGIFEEGRDVEQFDVVFNDGGFHSRFRADGNQLEWDQVSPGGVAVHDWQSALAFMRVWNPEPGTRGFFYAQSGRSFYRVEVAAGGVEKIRLELGSFDCQRFEGQARRLDRQGELVPDAEPKPFSLWFTHDDRHLPVRVAAETTFGSVFVELIEFQRSTHAEPLRIRPSR